MHKKEGEKTWTNWFVMDLAKDLVQRVCGEKLRTVSVTNANESTAKSVTESNSDHQARMYWVVAVNQTRDFRLLFTGFAGFLLLKNWFCDKYKNNEMLKIRLQRIGKRGQAYFRVVVMEHTKKPKGKYLEDLGAYDPHKNEISVDAERVKYWLSHGAQASPTVNNLLVGKGVIEGEKVRAWKRKPQKHGTEPGKTEAKEKQPEVEKKQEDTEIEKLAESTEEKKEEATTALAEAVPPA